MIHALVARQLCLTSRVANGGDVIRWYARWVQP